MCEHVFENLTNTPQFVEDYGQWGLFWVVFRCKKCGVVEAFDHTVDLHERRIMKFDDYEFEDCPESENFYM